MTQSNSTIDSIDSRRPSDAVRVPETLLEGDTTSYDDQWASTPVQRWSGPSTEQWLSNQITARWKMSDNDSGTDLNNASESEPDDSLVRPESLGQRDSETESGYRGRILSNSDDDLNKPITPDGHLHEKTISNHSIAEECHKDAPQCKGLKRNAGLYSREEPSATESLITETTR